jgi:hypothetical protein
MSSSNQAGSRVAKTPDDGTIEPTAQVTDVEHAPKDRDPQCKACRSGPMADPQNA